MAVSTLPKEYIYKDYSVTTATNANVSPFGAYQEFRTTHLQGYSPISCELIGAGSSNPSVARISIINTSGGEDVFFIYSRSALTLTLRVLYGETV